MSANTEIGWTDHTWPVVRGCSKISDGCKFCWAIRDAHLHAGNKNQKMQQHFGGLTIIENGRPNWTGEVRLDESILDWPLRWKKPARIFAASSGDLFHEDLPFPDILRLFQIMAKCQRHTFQILTKRPEKMRELLSLCWWRNLGYSPAMGGDYWVKVIAGKQRDGDVNFLPNVWLGVSVEDPPTAKARITELLRTPAALRFVSYEPALTGVDFSPFLPVRPWDREQIEDSVDWIIVGGESGPQARPFDIEWARETIRQCEAAGVPVFVKQLGLKPFQSKPHHIVHWFQDRKAADWVAWPADLRIREFPR